MEQHFVERTHVLADSLCRWLISEGHLAWLLLCHQGASRFFWSRRMRILCLCFPQLWQAGIWLPVRIDSVPYGNECPYPSQDIPEEKNEREISSYTCLFERLFGPYAACMHADKRTKILFLPGGQLQFRSLMPLVFLFIHQHPIYCKKIWWFSGQYLLCTWAALALVLADEVGLISWVLVGWIKESRTTGHVMPGLRFLVWYCN